MGRRGYVQVRQPEYGKVAITDWCQSEVYDFLTRKGLDVSSCGDMCNTEDADHWEINLPSKLVKDGGKKRYVTDYGKIWKVIEYLKKHPGSVKCEGEPMGENLASLLEEGVKSAEKREYGCIAIDWF